MGPEFSFGCNVCGQSGVFRSEHYIDLERPSCTSCGANVRFRWLVHRLSFELFGQSIPLPEFPRDPSIKGLGLTDPDCIATTLAKRFRYRNTYLHAKPRLDIRTDPSPIGELDFLITSEVFEHVEPPVQRAFRNAASFLKPSGVLLLTVPWVWDGSDALPELYDWKLDREGDRLVIVNRRRDGKVERYYDPSPDGSPGKSLGYTREHFPELHKWKLLHDGEAMLLENRRLDGTVEMFHNLTFHGGPGAALEMRLFTKRGLESSLREAGFLDVEFESTDCPKHGIIFPYPWSLPVVARIESKRDSDGA